MTMPRLSLCIPTYNRAPLLRQALEAVMAQITQDLAASVEIVVSDNASTDGTPAVLSEMAAAYPHVCLRPHRQPQNRGPDANIYETVKRASGEFCYILSDDDVLLPGAVARLLGLMGEHPEADALALNIQSFARDLDQPDPPWNAVAEDAVLYDRDEALALLRPMFVSVFAFRRGLATAHAHDDKAGTNLLQSYFFLDVLASARAVIVTARPYLAQRKDNTAGWPYWSVMTTGYHDLLGYARRLGFSEQVLRAMSRRHLRQEIFGAIRHYKLTGRNGPLSPTPAAYADGTRRLLRIYGPDPFLLLALLPLMLTPCALVMGARRVVKALRRAKAHESATL